MLKFLRFNIGNFLGGYDEVRLLVYKHCAKYELLFIDSDRVEEAHLYEKKRFTVKNFERIAEWDDLNINSWEDKYYKDGCDGWKWELTYREDEKKTRHIHGSNAYPDPSRWNQFIYWMDSLMPEMQFAKPKENKKRDIDDEIGDKWDDLQEAKTDAEKEAAWRNFLERDGWKLSKEEMDLLMGRDEQPPKGEV